MATAPLLPVPPASPASAQEFPPLSEGARIVNTFIAPSKTFTDLRRNASWWGPWLLIAIFSLLFVYAMGRQIGFEQISRNQIAHSSRADQFDKLPPDQQAKQIHLSANIIRYAAYGSPVLILFYFLISTVVLWVTFKIAAGVETSFGQAYAIVMYAGLPGIIGAILGIVSLFAGVDPEGFDVSWDQPRLLPRSGEHGKGSAWNGVGPRRDHDLDGRSHWNWVCLNQQGQALDGDLDRGGVVFGLQTYIGWAGGAVLVEIELVSTRPGRTNASALTWPDLSRLEP
jgi:hypothetical protein